MNLEMQPKASPSAGINLNAVDKGTLNYTG